jgi:hypothetical protein
MVDRFLILPAVPPCLAFLVGEMHFESIERGGRGFSAVNLDPEADLPRPHLLGGSNPILSPLLTVTANILELSSPAGEGHTREPWVIFVGQQQQTPIDINSEKRNGK